LLDTIGGYGSVEKSRISNRKVENLGLTPDAVARPWEKSSRHFLS